MTPLAPATGSPTAVARPKLFRDASFWGITLTQFLGAFNDNVFKQALMLLFVAVPIGNGQTQDLQSLGTFVFSIPFILFSGYAGYLSDCYCKRRVIVLAKVAEIVIMVLGLVTFLIYARTGMSITMAAIFSIVLFLMGAQSAFFGPGKYGILPELFRENDLPRTNGLVLMTTFLAIILGGVLAGLLMESFPGKLWIIGVVCVAIAVIGTITAAIIRRTPISQPGLAFTFSALGVPKEMRIELAKDRPLAAAVWVSTIFWLTAAMVQMGVTSLGKVQLQVGDAKSALMVSLISIGIAIGSVLAGQISRGKFHTGVLKAGSIGLATTLALLALPGGDHGHLLGYYGSLVVLLVMGIFTGMFAVPLQVFMQMRPPAELTGRMIATQNLLNWIGIVGSAIFYAIAMQIINALKLPQATIFAVTAVLMAGVALLYHPATVELGSGSAASK